ncbi:porin family protein [Vibrio rumoiensis]|uniref:porin family protein n=1 Tax=Vibrio rumoiensis TaxID=76258 RepID=UPI000B5C4141|nr:porin family protein [Vibrio rumoiensis]
MMRKIFIYSGLLGIFASPATFANNLEPHMYMGLLYSYADVSGNVEINNEEADFDNSMLGVALGYQFHKNFAIEARGYGSVSDDEVGGYKVKVNNHFNVLGKGILPLDDNGYFRIYGLLGFGQTKISVSSDSESETDFLYGAGMSFSTNKPISFDVEWVRAFDDESFGISHASISGDMFNLNLVYHFN